MAEMYAPTGWIYDLWSGTGTGQGQMPDSSLSVVRTQADVEDSYVRNSHITTSKEGLIEAPLLCLRDTEYAGERAGGVIACILSATGFDAVLQQIPAPKFASQNKIKRP